MTTNNNIYDNIDSIDIPHNYIVSLMNDLFKFKREHMPGDSLIDVIQEFSYKHNYDPVQVTQELAEYEGFQDIMYTDCIKFKYIQPDEAETGDTHSLDCWN